MNKQTTVNSTIKDSTVKATPKKKKMQQKSKFSQVFERFRNPIKSFIIITQKIK